MENNSSVGTINGGSLTIRSRPSTTVVSLPRACRLSRVRALVTMLAARVAMRLSAFEPDLAAVDWSSASTSATSMREYQTSMVDRPASRAISER